MAALKHTIEPKEAPPQLNILRIRLEGRLTLGPQLLEFGRAASEEMKSRRPLGVVIDAGGIEEVDSAGLGELVVLYTLSRQIGARLCLMHPPARIVQILGKTRLTEILRTFTDAEQAVLWIRGRW